MSSLKKTVLIFTGIFAVCVIGAGITLAVYFGGGSDLSNFGNIFGANRHEVNEGGDIALDGVSAVQIDCAAANVHILKSGQAGVKLEGYAVTSDPAEKYLNLEKRGGTLYIEVEHRQRLFEIENFELTVSLPEGGAGDIDLELAAGNADISGLKLSSLKISNQSGNLRIEGCEAQTLDCGLTAGNTDIINCSFGSAGVVSKSGNVNVKDTPGSFNIRNTAGRVDIKGAKGAMDVSCITGDVNIDFAEGGMGAVNVGATAGSIRLDVPKDAAFDLEAKATAGNVTSDFDIEVTGSVSGSFAGREVIGKVNGGGEKVSVAVTAGNITISSK